MLVVRLFTVMFSEFRLYLQLEWENTFWFSLKIDCSIVFVTNREQKDWDTDFKIIVHPTQSRFSLSCYSFSGKFGKLLH